MLIYVALLFASLMIGHAVLRRSSVEFLQDAGVTLLLGCAFGLFVRFTHGREARVLAHLTRFDRSFFFVVLLPPIIFECGFSMRQQRFANNIISILVYAILVRGGAGFAVFVSDRQLFL